MRVAHKLTAVLVVGILLVHGVATVITIQRESRQLHEDIERDERTLGRSLSVSVSRIWGAFGEQEALLLIREVDARHVVEVRWIWLDAKPGDAHAAAAAPAVLAPLARGESVVVRLGSDRDAVYTYVPTEVPGNRIGAIEIADVLDDEAAYLRASIQLAIISGFVLVCCCGILTWVVGRTLVDRPVRRLLRYTHDVGTGNLTHRLDARSRDEFGELSVALNTMCESLEQAREHAEAEGRARLDAVEQLRHADRLATVGTFAAGVAHELGTPINVIEGHAQLIREDRAAHEPTIQNAAVITKQCKRMTGIIQDLLRFARRCAPSGSTVDVGDVARETLRMCDVLLRKRDVQATIETTGHHVAQIAAEPMQQILTNIVVNAIHAMPDGGSLSLQLSREQTSAPGDLKPAEYVCVRVEDSGVGMNEETRRRIFEPFFTTKDVGEGTGLGLSVALGIAKDHNGWIDVASEPGCGTVVSIYLPAHDSRSP